MSVALASGLLLGITCGLSPGPLMALVLLQALRHGTREGCKVACVPLLSDLPMVVVALAFALHAAQIQRALGIICLLGSVFILFLAVESFRPARLESAKAQPPNSLLKGTLVNLLSPYPWLFWLTIGTGILAQAIKESWVVVAVFLGVFYFGLVGSKLVIAVMAGRSRQFLGGRAYRVVMGLLGMLLGVFAALFFRQGLLYLR